MANSSANVRFAVKVNVDEYFNELKEASLAVSDAIGNLISCLETANIKVVTTSVPTPDDDEEAEEEEGGG